MTFPPNPYDRPDPLDNMPAVRARVPDHVASGEISTGVIVVTGGTEYVLDFVRNLPRPNCVVSRVVLPHLVMPQFIDALSTNIELFRQRYGDLPGTAPVSNIGGPAATGQGAPQHGESHLGNENAQPTGLGATSNFDDDRMRQDSSDIPNTHQSGLGATGGSGPSGIDPHSPPSQAGNNDPLLGGNDSSSNPSETGPHSSPAQQPRRQNPQEVYDDLKIRDDILSGAYANAVMIGHGPYEFSFDFITQFYPQPAVSARVFMASGHVGRLLDSLKTSWEQIRGRYGYPPKN